MHYYETKLAFIQMSSFPHLLLFSIPVIICYMGFPGGSVGKESAHKVGDLVQSLAWEVPLEKEMATHSTILAWKIHYTVYGVTKSWT